MLQKELFKNPPRAFSTLPFWFWNDVLDEDEIKRQIRDFDNKGVHGFIIHPRKGLPKSIPYMSDLYLDYVEVAVKEAKALDSSVFAITNCNAFDVYILRNATILFRSCIDKHGANIGI